MQADQTVISLRPGGGGALRGNRFIAPRFDSSAHTLRLHSGGLAPVLKVASNPTSPVSSHINSSHIFVQAYLEFVAVYIFV